MPQSCMEKRMQKRYPRQMPVRFGEKSPDHIGLTHDISLRGIFLKSSRIFPHPTKLVIGMELANGKTIQCEGIVKWAKRVPPAIARVMLKNGMGVFLTYSPEDYSKFIRSFDTSTAIPTTIRKS